MARDLRWRRADSDNNILRKILGTLQGQNTGADGVAANINVGGNVGGYTTTIVPAVTVQAAAYAANDVVGGTITVPGVVRAAGSTAIWHSVQICDRAEQEAELLVLLFDRNPANATTTDNAPFAFGGSDANLLGKASLATWSTTGGSSVATEANLGIPVKPVAGLDLYAVIIAVGTPTFAATNDLVLRLGFLQD